MCPHQCAVCVCVCVCVRAFMFHLALLFSTESISVGFTSPACSLWLRLGSYQELSYSSRPAHERRVFVPPLLFIQQFKWLVSSFHVKAKICILTVDCAPWSEMRFLPVFSSDQLPSVTQYHRLTHGSPWSQVSFMFSRRRKHVTVDAD